MCLLLEIAEHSGQGMKECSSYLFLPPSGSAWFCSVARELPVQVVLPCAINFGDAQPTGLAMPRNGSDRPSGKQRQEEDFPSSSFSTF